MSLFDHCCKIPLAIDIIVERLNIDGALGILVSTFATLVLFKLIQFYVSVKFLTLKALTFRN